MATPKQHQSRTPSPRVSDLHTPHSPLVTRHSSLVTRHSSPGFTLLEILLVVLVIAIVAGAFMPIALDSIEGVRLRSATRDVVSLNRYARARAILDRRPVAVLYDREGGVVELLLLPVQELALGPFLDSPAARLQEDPDFGSDQIERLRRRQLSTHVVVEEVRGAEAVSDTWFVVYTPSGMTDPHTVILRDNRNDRMRIRVNGMTGDITLGDGR
ncbi:MAG: prepilin-type N-terminal cleavage/methylation domain-containing protein [Verrucomicrobia bacterium]|nr:prepilin-type N-terminal cleavage/methylation domain-containing protein [Verrucomicrobiota bacterium]MCH8528771.1 GspH/FimT family pseudopilin [Kiritimatiellia bacterium]